MIAALLVAIQAAAPMPVPAQAPLPVLAVPPASEWPALPLYPLPRQPMLAHAATFVRVEVESGRCRPLTPPATGSHVVATVVLLIGQDGGVHRIVPQAIGCPTVEQFTVGYLQSLLRTDTGSALRPPPGWYRAVVTFSW